MLPTEDTPIDQVALRAFRLGRLRSEMADRDIGACVLTDPVNIRYACGARNMQIFTARNPARYLFVTVEGPVILFEFTGALHLADGLETVTEVRQATTASFVAAGEAIADVERAWAAQIASLVRETVGTDTTVGLERVNAGAAFALAAEGVRLVDAQAPVERARAVKGPDELACQVASMRATERAMAVMEAELRPGLTENELWSVFHQHVIAQGADYIETRLLSSGSNTNPWFQETSEKVIGADELVAFDTDVVGCHGYYADYSRTFHAGPGMPSSEQRELYRIAYEQVHHNMGIIEPGLTFAQYSERAWDLPERFAAHRYYLSSHGVGMTGEYPYLYHAQDFAPFGYGGVIEPGMTLCVESFIGGPDTTEGVKLEQQILVTETGTELMSQYPFDEALLA
ncbi:MAG: M24 family metallopeptidase [Acidimicrobiales bacterium]